MPILTGPVAVGDLALHRHRATLKVPNPVLHEVVVHAVDMGQELPLGALEVRGLVILVDPGQDRRGQAETENQRGRGATPLLGVEVRARIIM